MFKRLMKHLTNNMGLKFLSILFSVVLWMIVVNVANPDGTKTFSVPVNIQNKDVIERMGKVPDVVGDTDIAVFSISGPRSYVEDMDTDDFNVTADLGQIDLTEEDQMKLVHIEITPKKYEKYIKIHQKTVNMQITLEELAEKNFVISPVTKGSPADGCAIGEVEVTPNLLSVSGPQSIVSKISKVTATINVNGVSGDVTDNVAPVLYDEEGKVISSELLEMNQSTVNIKANILGTRSLVIKCDVTGEPAEGYAYMGLEYAPKTVEVKGEAEMLNALNGLSIPEGEIDITGATSNIERTIDINDYLPKGVSLVDEEKNQIAVKALIVQKQMKVFNFPTANINVDGLRSSYEFTYNVTAVPVTIRASQEKIDIFDIGSIQAKLDASELEPGVHTVQLDITINSEDYELVGSVSVQIEIKDKNAEIETMGGTEGENSTDNTNQNNSDSQQNSDRNNSINGR